MLFTVNFGIREVFLLKQVLLYYGDIERINVAYFWTVWL